MRVESIKAIAVILLATATGAAQADFTIGVGVLPPPKPLQGDAAQVKPAPPLAKPEEASKPKPNPPVPEVKQPVWLVKPGARLRAVLDEFTSRAGWAIEINYKDEQTLDDKDLILGGGLRVEGDFKKAIISVFEALPASAKIRAELWSENTPPTLFVYREGTAK